MDMISKDIISSLPEALICHILSFLPTKEAALTSLLSQQWRYLFALSTTLDFEDSVLNNRSEMSWSLRGKEESHRMFMDFVDRVLRLQGNSTIHKFSLKCRQGVFWSDYFSRWMTNVVERGVSHIDLRDFCFWWELISIVFVSKSLVRLMIESEFCVLRNMKEVFLPKLKTLHLGQVVFGDSDNYSLVKLVSGCPVLEDLFLDYIVCEKCDKNLYVSSKTLKSLKLNCRDNIPLSVLFDTPNLVYFEYSGYGADKYEIVNFDSLLEARINLTSHGDMVCNAIGLPMGISSVQCLYLFANTLEILTVCSEQIPVFKNLIHLTIQTYRKSGWELLPALLKNCQNLETLVFEFEALKHHYRCTIIPCECQYKISGEILTFLSSSPVKFLEIRRFSGTGVEKFIEKVKQLLETMPSLEQLTMYYYTSIDDDLIKVSSQLRSQTRVASPNCQIKVIDHLCSSFTVASSSPKK